MQRTEIIQANLEINLKKGQSHLWNLALNLQYLRHNGACGEVDGEGKGS